MRMLKIFLLQICIGLCTCIHIYVCKISYVLHLHLDRLCILCKVMNICFSIEEPFIKKQRNYFFIRAVLVCLMSACCIAYLF